jgi:mono/diheme cytochrome c family protein
MLSGATSALASDTAADSRAKPDPEVLFVRRVAPLLREKCLACHGADAANIEGGLNLAEQARTLAGGDSGQPAIVPGDAASSPLFQAVLRSSDTYSAMPPKDAERLSDQQVGWLREWINAGAPWPDADRIKEIEEANATTWSAEDGVAVETSGGLSEDWTNRRYQPDALWAYQPLQRDPAGPQSIDEFLGTVDAAAADEWTLQRRMAFDLTGLPPAVVCDPSGRSDPTAVVEQLLSSPHYGERMAQHWLDVVRYADSGGFSNDYERGNAWRYRDYVVRSFNADKPYDQFTREQIAGDEIDPANPELLIATGFLRMGPWELTGMEVAKVARQRFLDDVTNSVGETFLAHSLQCARCHDHKFDPIPTRDYYSIQSVFATTQMAERPAGFLPDENVSGFEEKKYLDAAFEDHRDRLRKLDEISLANAERWFAETGTDSTLWDQKVAEAREAVQSGGFKGRMQNFAGVFQIARQRMRQAKAAEADYPPNLVGFTAEEFGNERVGNKGMERLRWEYTRYEPLALAVYSGHTPDISSVYAPLSMPDDVSKGELEQTCILTGGDPFSPAEQVAPGVLSVIANGASIPSAVSGRRRAFAEWLTDPRNPLTARVMVNRIWMWHFGEPLAGNPNNFGATGKRPTNAALLDWLAVKFIESGWSVKAMHRLILSSAAYRSLQFVPRRLSAEELRDAMLAATGELNRTLGGIPCRPEINEEVALQPRMVMGTFAKAWIPNPLPSQRHRRSLYVHRLRGLPDPAMEVFNSPAPDFSCERRDSSTVTPQVFSLFNSQSVHTRALALAARVIRETADDEAAIQRCFQLCFSRDATADELSACRAHWQNTLRSLPPSPPLMKPPLKVTREAVEENTGEPFAFTERLHACADFVPDLQSADCDNRTRALADVCLVLFNSNEFAYVY